MRPLLLTMVLVGCVPKGRYELAQVQLEATQTAFQTREAKAMKNVADARSELAQAREALDEREVQVEALQERILELERQSDKQAERDALSFFNGLEACPPLPEIPPCPTCEGAPVDEEPEPRVEPEAPEVTEKRARVEASIEQVSQALKRASRAEMRATERKKQHAVVVKRLQGLVDQGYAEIVDTGSETVVRVLVAKLFNENRTTLSPLGETIVKELAGGLTGLEGYRMNVVGHTDDRPVSSVEYPSNWELGFAYAMGVLRGLEYEGLTMKSVVTSQAGTVPVAKGTTKEARRLNRRVEIRIALDPTLLDRPVVRPEKPEPAPTEEEKEEVDDALESEEPDELPTPEGPDEDNEPEEVAPE